MCVCLFNKNIICERSKRQLLDINIPSFFFFPVCKCVIAFNAEYAEDALFILEKIGSL